MVETAPFQSQVTYFVESAQDGAALLAIDPRIEHGRLEWFDTVHDRVFKVDQVDVQGDMVVVKTPKAEYRFSPLTLERYAARVRAVVDGHPDFSSTEELQKYYRDFPR